MSNLQNRIKGPQHTYTRFLCLLCVVFFVGSGLGVNLPVVAGQNESGQNNTTGLTENPSSYVNNPPGELEVHGPGAHGTTNELKSDLLTKLNLRVDLKNETVKEKASGFAVKHPGDCTIEQVCAIFGYLKCGDLTTNGWKNTSHTRGTNEWNYANYTLIQGLKYKCSGFGDCSDFAILISALIESIGGTTRIVLVNNTTTGNHAYTEVYLGNSSNSQDVIQYLKQEYSTDKIYTDNNNSDPEDVWLNLDWSADYPGGLLHLGSEDGAYEINRQPHKTQVTLPENYDHVIDGIELVNKGQYDDAIKELKYVLGKNENLSDAWVALGFARVNKNIHEHRNNYTEVINDYNRAIELNRNYAIAWVDKGQALHLQGNYSESIDAFDKATEIYPTLALGWYLKGLNYVDLGMQEEAFDTDTAIKMYERSIQAFDKAIELKLNPQYAANAKNKQRDVLSRMQLLPKPKGESMP